MDGKTVEKTWTYRGHPCVVIVIDNGLGMTSPYHALNTHRCGYVGVTKGHPLYGKDYAKYIPALGGDSIQRHFGVHGNVTFTGDGDGSPLYGLDGNGDPFWWIGFDCAHASDINDPKSLDYCIAECKSLAKQLDEMSFG